MVVSQAAIDARARRAPRRVGLVARKSRWRIGTIDNRGGFMLVDPSTNAAVAGWRFDMESDEVIEYCADRVG